MPQRPSSLTKAPEIVAPAPSCGRCRKVNDGPVLGYDGVDEMKVARHSSELGEDAPGDEKDEDASRPQRSNRVSHRFVQQVPIRNRAVVVERDGLRASRGSSCISGCKAGATTRRGRFVRGRHGGMTGTARTPAVAVKDYRR